MRINDIISETTAGAVAGVVMPLFTGKKGKAHKKAARKAVGLESKDNSEDILNNDGIIRRINK